MKGAVVPTPFFLSHCIVNRLACISTSPTALFLKAFLLAKWFQLL